VMLLNLIAERFFCMQINQQIQSVSDIFIFIWPPWERRKL
jgi:hypothetical protein